MGAALVPCGRCRRHIRRTESSCPFCGEAIEGASPRRAFPRERLGTVAWFTFALGVGASLSAPACGGISDPDGEERESLSDAGAGDPASDAGAGDDNDDGGWSPSDAGGDDPLLDASTPDASEVDAGEVDAGNYDPYDGGPIPIYRGVPKG